MKMKMKTIKASLLGCGTATLLASSFFVNADSGLPGTDLDYIPAGSNDYIQLGTAYNSTTGEFLNFQTVQGIYTDAVGIADTEFFLKEDQNYQQLASVINGSVTANVKFPVASVNAGASIALESGSDSLSANWVVMVRNNAKSKVLRKAPGKSDVELSAAGQTIVNKGLSDSDLLAAAGDEFVYEIERGAYLFVVMKAEFLSQADKLDFTGAMDVDLAVGKVEGSVSLLDDDKKARINVTVRAHQFGGDPLQLTTIIPDNFAKCSAVNFEECRTLFKTAIEYAQGINSYQGNGFKDQIIDANNANVLAYRTQKYTAVASSVEDLGRPTYQLDPSHTQTLKDLQVEFAKEMENGSRAEALLSKSGAYLNRYQTAALRNISKVSVQNAEAMRDLINYCETHPLISSQSGTPECTDYLNANCPLVGGERSCFSIYSTKLLEFAETDPLELTMQTYSERLRHQNVGDFVKMLTGAKDSANGVNWSYEAASGGRVITPTNGFLQTGAFTEERSGRFLMLSTDLMSEANPVATSGSVDGSFALWVYTANGWEIGREKSYNGNVEVFQSVLNSAKLGPWGYKYYLVEWSVEGSKAHRFKFQSMNGQSYLYFDMDSTAVIRAASGNLDDTSPMYFSGKSLTYDRASDNSQIGYCKNDNNDGKTRNMTEYCYARARHYSGPDAVKACAKYNDDHEAATGMFWSLPTKPDWQKFVSYMDAIQPNMSSVLSRNYIDTTGRTATNVGGLNSHDAGLLRSDRNSVSTYNGYWGLPDNQGDTLWPTIGMTYTNYASLGTRRNKNIYLQPVRCIGKFTK